MTRNEAISSSDTLPQIHAKTLNDIHTNSHQYCLLDNFPFPVFQRGPNCKLMMLYYLMEYQRLNSGGDKSFPQFAPVRKKIFVGQDERYFNQQANELNWQLSKEHQNTAITTRHYPALSFLFKYGTTSLRAQAKSLGSMVGEVYDPRILTTLAKKNGFSHSGFYLPEATEYIRTIQNSLHHGIPVGVFFDIDLERQGTYPVNKASQNEHACVIIGYFVDKNSQLLHFVVINWGTIAYIEANKLRESAYQLANRRELEVFAAPSINPSKWLNATEDMATMLDHDFELTRKARELLPDHVSLRGKLFVVDTRSNKPPVTLNIYVDNIKKPISNCAFNSEVIIPAKDYTQEHAQLKQQAADAYDSFDESESDSDDDYFSSARLT